MTPLIGALCGRHEDLALHLVTLSGQDIQKDPNRHIDGDKTILHMCAELGLTRVVKEFVRRGADMDLWDDEHHTPLCLAVRRCHIPLVSFLLKQYQARGQAELERALNHPCEKEGSRYSLL
jgi:ankyrin repeat protein